jgi:WD40 repeat protein/serine/threonine protein kinase
MLTIPAQGPTPLGCYGMGTRETDAASEDGDADDGSQLEFDGLTEFLRMPVEVSAGDLAPGTRLGDVTIIRLIAEGGMGRVYEGLQGMPCRSVAVKVIRPGVVSPSAMKRFRFEAHILGRLTHPGVARIYTVGMQRLSGALVPFFVMEFVEDARTITAYATQRGLSTRDRVSLFRDACQAVAYGHHRGVIHRDLKPGNMLVDAAGNPKIIDFGIARSTDGDVPLTTLHTDVGKVVGTLQYMSPEQFDGTTHDLDVRADVYSLGIVLFELLTERSPYDLTSRPVHEVARLVMETEPLSLSSANPRLRGDLNTIVGKCLEKNRDLRYSNAAELEADLGRYLRGEPIAASPPTLFDSIIRLARRHRMMAGAAASVLLAGLLSLVSISMFLIRSESMRRQAEAAREEAIAHARVASQEREAARREGLRADVEANHAKQRLYVANMRSLRASIAAKSLRMARQLYAENTVLAGRPLPLEMHCLGSMCDDSLAARDLQTGPVERIEYSPDGRMLMALLSQSSPSAQSLPDTTSVVRHLHERTEGTRARARLRFLFYSVGDHCRLDPALTGVADAEKVWIDRMRQSIGIGSLDAVTGTALADSPDARRRAILMADGRIGIVETATGDLVAALQAERLLLRRVLLNRGGSCLATQHADDSLSLWSGDDGRLLTRCGEKAAALSFDFSPDGSRFAAVLRSSDVQQRLMVYEAADGALLSEVRTDRPGGTRSVVPLDFSPNGRHVVTTAGMSEVLVHAIGDAASDAILRGHHATVEAVAFSHDGRQIASGAANGHIHLWDAASLSLERVLMGHDGAIRTLSFCPSGETLASGSQDGTMRIWSCGPAQSLSELPAVRGMTAAAFRPDGRQLAVAGVGTGSVELWDPRTLERICTLACPQGPVEQITFSPDGTLVTAASADTVLVWRTDSGDLVSTLAGHPSGAVAAAFSPDGMRLLTTAGDMTAMIWDPRSGKRLMAAPAYRSFTNINTHGAVFGLHGDRVAHDGAQLLDAVSGITTVKLPKRGRVSCLASSPDGRVLASGRPIGTVYLDDFSDGKPLARIVAHGESVRAMAFSPDGVRIATSSVDATVRLWDTRNGAPVQRFVGHEGAVETLAFSPDGRRLITSAKDGTVRIWDADGGHELCLLPGQREHPRAIAVSPDGTRLVTASDGGPIRIWGLTNAAVMLARQSAATPTLTSLP